MAIRDEKELGKSKKIAIVWVLLSLFVACVIGVVGRAYLDYSVLAASSSENVYIEMIKKIFMQDTRLPIIGGILLCGILAAIMSTADSQLLVSASSVSKDLCKGVLFKNMTDKQVLMVSRITVIAVAVVAYIIAWNPDSSIMGLVSDAWAGLGSAFGPAILLSLYWKRTNLYGAAAGMISGGLTVIIWDYIKCMKLDGVMVTPATYTGLYSLLVGFVISIVIIVVVSLLTPKVNGEILQAFEDVKNGDVE
jgi:sodium/proline symporter